jgi:hypothetical protein
MPPLFSGHGMATSFSGRVANFMFSRWPSHSLAPVAGALNKVCAVHGVSVHGVSVHGVALHGCVRVCPGGRLREGFSLRDCGRGLPCVNMCGGLDSCR